MGEVGGLCEGVSFLSAKELEEPRMDGSEVNSNAVTICTVGEA